MIKLYAIKDNVSGVFSTPVCHHNDAEAERTFKTNFTFASMKDDKVNPEDYSLYRLGEMDEETGVISNTNVQFVSNFEPVKPYIDRYIEIHKEN